MLAQELGLKAGMVVCGLITDKRDFEGGNLSTLTFPSQVLPPLGAC